MLAMIGDEVKEDVVASVEVDVKLYDELHSGPLIYRIDRGV